MKRRCSSGAPSPRLGEPSAQLRDLLNRLHGHRFVRTPEDGVVAGEEEQRVIALGELLDRERQTRLLREAAGLEDLEPMERADDHVGRRGHAVVGVGRVLPVLDRLLAMLRQAVALGGRLHLEQADARPQQVHEATVLRRLELSDLLALGAVAGEELVQEGLCPTPLAAVVLAPVGGEPAQVRADLIALQGHERRRSGGEGALLGGGIVGGVHQPPVLVREGPTARFERLKKLPVGILGPESVPRLLGPAEGRRDAQEHRFRLTLVSFVALVHLVHAHQS